MRINRPVEVRGGLRKAHVCRTTRPGAAPACAPCLPPLRDAHVAWPQCVASQAPTESALPTPHPLNVQPGAQLWVRCTHIDVQSGVYRLEAVPPAHVRADSVVNGGAGLAAAYAAASYL